MESHQEVTVAIINLSLYRLENVMGLGKCIKVKELGGQLEEAKVRVAHALLATC